MWAGTVCFLVNHALAPAPSQQLGNICWRIKASPNGFCFFMIPDPIAAFPGQEKVAQHPKCVFFKVPLRLLFSNWPWKRIDSHDQEDRKRELTYMAPGSANPLVETTTHRGPSQGAWWRMDYWFLSHSPYSMGWFCLSCFWRIDLPYRSYLLLWKQCFQSSFTYSPPSV